MYLKEHVDELGNAIEKKTATGADGEANFEGLTPGYYFVTSSAGSLAALHEDTDIATLVEKNTMLDDEKEVDEENAQVGDVLTYTITLTDGKGTNLAATVTDTLSKGLTYNNDATATEDFEVEVTENSDGTTTVVYTFSAETMTALDEGDTIEITYTATVNADAAIDGTVSNTEFTQYSEQKTDGDETETKLTDMTVLKTDGSDALKGAQFKLFRTDEALGLDHVDVKVRELTDDELAAGNVTKADDTIYYTVDPEGTNLIDMTDASSAVVYGLDKDSTYFLQETVAPAGYNLLDEEVEVNLGSTTEITVVNTAGSELPSTGGMGTTLFYVVGGLMVAGAAIALIAKNRVAKMEA